MYKANNDLPAIESNPAFVYLVKHHNHLQPLNRAVPVQALLNAGYSARHIADRLTASGSKLDESSVRRDSVVARLPECYKQLIRSGISVSAALRKAKADGALPELAPAVSPEVQQIELTDSENGAPSEEAGLDRDTYLRELHARIEGIGPELEKQRQRNAEHRQRTQTQQFGIPAKTHEDRMEILRRQLENIDKIQAALDEQHRQEQDYRARMRARQFGKTGAR